MIKNSLLKEMAHAYFGRPYFKEMLTSNDLKKKKRRMRILSAPYFSKSFGGKKIEICTAFTMEKYLNKLSKESFLINN